MNKNVYIAGAQCTGKTTLVNQLEAHFKNKTEPPSEQQQPAIIREVARTVLAKHSFTAADITSSTERCLTLQKLILEAQAAAERHEVHRNDRTWFISDRSGADPIAYALHHIGPDAADTLLASTEWHELRSRMRDSLVIVCEPGADWLFDDGVRLMPASMEDWKTFHSLFCRLLGQEVVKYVVLPSSILEREDRLQFVLGQMEIAMGEIKQTSSQP